MYNIGSSIVDNNLTQKRRKQHQHQCQNCQIQFQNAQQLYNHHKNFCINSGFDTLAGLNIKLKNPILRQKKKQTHQSLLNALDELQKNKQYEPYKKQVQRDMNTLQNHRQTLQYSKPYYLNTSQLSKGHNVNQNYGSRSFQNYQEQAQLNTNLNKYSRVNKSYSINESQASNNRSQAKNYISPPTEDYRNKISILNRSNSSIKNMPQYARRQYVLKKIIQLQNIQQNYVKNGGKDKQFLQNIKKMQVFYNNLKSQKALYEQQTLINSQFSRVSTPIIKLRELKQSVVSQSIDIRSQISKKLSHVKQLKHVSDINNKQWAKKQTKMKQILRQSSAMQQDYIKNIGNKYGKDNNIIMIPYPHFQPQPYVQQKNSNGTNANIKLLQEMMKIKGQENSKLIAIIQNMNSQTKAKYQQQLKRKQKQSAKNQKLLRKLQTQNRRIRQQHIHQAQRLNTQIMQNQNNAQFNNSFHNFRVKRSQRKFRTEPQEEYKSRNKNLFNTRQLNLSKDGFSQVETLQIQEKVLRQMQQEERDQFQIFSNLPPQLQQLKLQSVKKSAEARAQVQKQILAQKMEKLKSFQNYHSFKLQRNLDNEDLEIQTKKMGIQRLIKKQVKQFAKNQYIQNQSSSQQSDMQSQHQGKEEDQLDSIKDVPEDIKQK